MINMWEINMKWFDNFIRKRSKPVIFCVHGFGVRRTHEFDELRYSFENKGYTFIIPEIFDQTVLDDIDPNEWINRVEKPLQELINRNKRVYLIGFSMGGVIASYLASKYKVERLVLIAPAFEYITVKAILDTVEGVARNLIKKTEVSSSDYPPLPDQFTTTFREIVARHKETIKHISCPVLIIHGTSDETIPIRSSEYAYDSVYHQNKRLIILKNVNHRILDDLIYKQDVHHIIDEFIHNRIIRIQDK